MSIIKPRTPPGVMELLPPEQIAFQRMLGIIQATYERYGFVPVETPVFELTDILLTKSGGETEKQVYFVQKTGDLQQGNKPDHALRFDLTVPLARFVAEHEHELAFPFRRYQIQKVYRGERPQRGRQNEITQCDIDVIGKETLSPIYDAEMPAIICEIFTKLAFGDFTINFSNRKILLGLLEAYDIKAETQAAVLRELDKLDKIGAAKVTELCRALGLEDKLIGTLLELASLRADYDPILQVISQLPQTPTLQAGYTELQTMCTALAAQGVPAKNARLNLGIVRGLDYYTGTVYETLVDTHPEFGSICSGGRYENLAGYYTKSKLPGVGISIGASRLFDQLRATGWAGAAASTTTQVLITLMDEKFLPDYLKIAQQLRAAGMATEVFFEGGKMAKQMKYADRTGIPLVLMLGADEAAAQSVTIKNMATGTQQLVPQASLVSTLQSMIA